MLQRQHLRVFNGFVSLQKSSKTVWNTSEPGGPVPPQTPPLWTRVYTHQSESYVQLTHNKYNHNETYIHILVENTHTQIPPSFTCNLLMTADQQQQQQTVVVTRHDLGSSPRPLFLCPPVSVRVISLLLTCLMFPSLSLWNVTSHNVQANAVWRYETWLRAGAYSDLSVRMWQVVRGRQQQHHSNMWIVIQKGPNLWVTELCGHIPQSLMAREAQINY